MTEETEIENEKGEKLIMHKGQTFLFEHYIGVTYNYYKINRIEVLEENYEKAFDNSHG